MSVKSSVGAAYDDVYGSEECGSYELNCKRWPRDRFEASVYFSPGGKRVLDVGCGNGLVLYNLRNKYEELHGVELSELRAATAQKTLNELDSHISVGDIESSLDYPDGYFDSIILADVIEHVVNLWPATQEITRLLSKGGSLVVCTPNIAFIPRRVKLMLGRFPATAAGNEGFALRTDQELFDAGHLHYFTFSMLKTLFERFGYSTLRTYGCGRFGRIHNIRPSILSGTCLVVATK